MSQAPVLTNINRANSIKLPKFQLGNTLTQELRDKMGIIISNTYNSKINPFINFPFIF